MDIFPTDPAEIRARIGEIEQQMAEIARLRHEKTHLVRRYSSALSARRDELSVSCGEIAQEVERLTGKQYTDAAIRNTLCDSTRSMRLLDFIARALDALEAQPTA